MKQLCIAVACSFLFIPAIAQAANFANQSIFLSTQAPVEGETLVIHAIVSNDSNVKFGGTLKLHEGDTSIGSVAVSLEPRGAYVASVSWKPSAGKHAITGTLEDADGTKVAEESQSFDIAVKKEPQSEATASSTAVGSSKQIQDTIAGFSPATAKASVPVFNAIDSVRTGAASALDKGALWAKGKAPTGDDKGSVLGAATAIGTGVLEKVLGALSYLVKNAALFYPVLAGAFLYGLWRLYARMRRPSY